MEFFEPPFHAHYQQERISSHYADPHLRYNTPPQHAPLVSLPHSMTKTTETKPRLGKDEVDILESEFQKNPKPTTQTKRQFAEEMGVDLARINNWFQNRRAKRKQEKKQEAYEAGRAQEAVALGYSAPSSPDLYNGFFGDNTMIPISHPPASFPMMPGPPVASFNPQYTDPATASLQSLQRTMDAAPTSDEEFPSYDDVDVRGTFRNPSVQDPSRNDHAQFLSPNNSAPHFHINRAYSYPSTFMMKPDSTDLYPTISELREAQEDNSSQTPTQFSSFINNSTSGINNPQLVASFPSELLPQSQPHDGVPGLSNSISERESPEGSNESVFGAFKYEVSESRESPIPPPGPSIPFKSPPPPMDIASRRKKVQVKPAALVADTLRSRPGMGPRTVSHAAADAFRRPSDSPLSSPMRRISSAGGNRNVLSGRIYKSGIESAQRSPTINLNGFADAGSFLEHNIHTLRNPPSLTGSSSINSSLAPPTPMSPPGMEMTLGKREMGRSTASPDSSLTFVFNNAGVQGCFTSMEGDQNLASPPETPQGQAQMTMNPSGSGWPARVEFQDTRQWPYDVPDEPLYTPGQELFPLEIQMPQPSYLSSMSQPVTPAFGQQFNQQFSFGGHESPRFKNESPQYTLSTQAQAEYTFPDSQSHYPTGMSPLTKQKTFQFSHTTPADFSDK